MQAQDYLGIVAIIVDICIPLVWLYLGHKFLKNQQINQQEYEKRQQQEKQEYEKKHQDHSYAKYFILHNFIIKSTSKEVSPNYAFNQNSLYLNI
ncbi:hypothetical protein CWO85_02075 [Candidatus Phytoplasma ziziphi]|uniref:Transmembrane protein n=1 Tax=Ziziphus jujuba witches'-broom phytoplasma TaxID=135727 RepID=A0A660HMM7_ZIZJU|nr:hypothetical protein [Candidatus Phytoplasma ziziphi]AYJ01203.1 hypothetical protein CWO85_01515 [Candidatus Phytoplasma ziziphi]AYJ01301.1 hypothetical protein CWO85_02075 [Candidatus Phytoplasma ziziphi]